MEKQKPNNFILNERNKQHERLMRNILSQLTETPLVLKGGTALYLGYGLNRFSEDLDFDSSKKLNLTNKIKNAVPHGIIIDEINLKKETNTVSRYMINYHIENTKQKDFLKVEVSYRNPPSKEQVLIKNGIKIASIERIAGNKLNAAFDGENPRIKGRDLFDLHFIIKNYGHILPPLTLERFKEFSQNPFRLANLYREDVQSDPLLNKIMDVELIALELNEYANFLFSQKELKGNKKKIIKP